MLNETLIAIAKDKYLELSLLSEQRDLEEAENLQYYYCLVLLEQADAVPDSDKEKVKKWLAQRDEQLKETVEHYTDSIIKIESPRIGHLIGEIDVWDSPVIPIFQELIGTTDTDDVVA